MASMKPGPAIILEEEADGGGASVDGEASSLIVCYSAFDDRDIDCNPYFPFAGPISDSGSGSYTDSEPERYIRPIDFFDRDSSEVDATEYLASEGLTADDFNIWGLYDPKEDEEEIVLGSRYVSGSEWDQQPGDSGEQGLRVTGIDSDSDYEDSVFDLTSGENDSGLPPVWDYALGEETALPDEEWEEVQNAINWRVRAFTRSQEEEEEEELSSASRVSSRDEHALDWQVLLRVNNVVNYIEEAEGIMINPGEIDPSYYASMDDAILAQLFGDETGIRGHPAAAKRVIEDLPVVELTVEEADMACAVCKDAMVVGEKVRRLPCSHSFHGDCIMPWLRIRNTCPLCRFELPTDDDDDDLHYETHI